jgi:plasmid segregation protein ParM
MMNMKNKPVVIGIDHGYGNMKTAHCCFRTGILPIDGNEPVFSSDILTYDGKSYVIGQGHKEFTADKMLDQDYYLLTLTAIARELHISLGTANKHIVHIYRKLGVDNKQELLVKLLGK